MSIGNLLASLLDRGVNIQLLDDNLKITAPGDKLSPELLAEIKEKKAELIAFFRKHARKQEEFAAITAAEKKEYYPMSSAQKRLYIVQQMMTDSIAYNMPVVLELTGDLDRGRLADVFHHLLERCESFRTSFHAEAEELMQKVHNSKDIPFAIEYHRLGINQEAEDVAPRANRFIQAESHVPYAANHVNTLENFIRPFDLKVAPLLRVGLFKQAEKKHILAIDMHHIISDGVSIGIFTGEFLALYAGRELPSLRIQYKDYSLWQDSEAQKKIIQNQGKFWLNLFPGEPPILNLPNDFPRPVIQSFAGNSINFTLESEVTLSLKKLALQEDVTLYMLLLSIYVIMLSKLSGQDDIVIGTPTAGRGHNDLKNTIGMFVNTLALRNYVCRQDTFRQFLAGVKESTIACFANQDYPYEKLVEEIVQVRDTGRNPLFDTLFALQNFDFPRLKLPGLIFNAYKDEKIMKISKFDLSLSCFDMGENLSIFFEYCTELFQQETISRFIKYFRRIADAVINQGDIKLRQIEIISEEEKKEILLDFNDTQTPYPGEKTIDRLFVEQVERAPDRVALIEPTDLASLTYLELDKRANRLAHILLQKGIKSDAIVAILADRSLVMIIGILAILKAGSAFLPLDPEFPESRIKYLSSDSAATLLLAQNHYKKTAQGCVEVIDLDDRQRREAVGSNLEQAHTSKNLAYIMYTSGSTGFPKGVLVQHESVIRLVMNTNYVELTGETRILQTGASAFDATTFEIWGALLHGGRLYLVHKNVILDARHFEQVLKKNHINMLWLGVSLFNQLSQQNNHIFSGLEWLLVGGDVLSPRHIDLVRNNNKKLKVVNGYGPTENTTFSTTYLIDREFADKIPIGKPIANSTAYIFDRYDNLQPLGVAGELLVGGDGVSRGYLNNPELTAEKFVSSYNRPYKTYTSYKSYFFERVYRTGDLARWLPDGNIEFLGRMDHQVKIRGFRIELGEIETQLLTMPGIKEAVVIDREDSSGQKYLCAYIAADKELDNREIMTTLAKTLPPYMIPGFIVQLEKIPLTPNGKVDRKALPIPGLQASRSYAPPTDEWEEKLVDIWSKALGLEGEVIGIDDSFFELGGHSLKATIIIAKIHEIFNIKVPLAEIFKTPTIRQIASLLRTIQLALNQETEQNQETDEMIL